MHPTSGGADAHLGVEAGEGRAGSLDGGAGGDAADAGLHPGVLLEELRDAPGVGGVARLAQRGLRPAEVEGDHRRAEVARALPLPLGEHLGLAEEELDRRRPEVDADLALEERYASGRCAGLPPRRLPSRRWNDR